jgi:AraC family transcriptional regulator of adaptative response / DNA-3-methyladenine glycosylase II
VPFAAPLTVPLPFVPPLHPDNLFGHLVATAVPGVEEWRDGAYRRTLRLRGGPGIAALEPPATGSAVVACTLRLSDAADAAAAVRVCRRVLDLDTDPVAVDARLAADDLLAPLVAAAPGRRVPGTAQPEEFALRAVLGQQVSTAAARTHAARLVAGYGEPVDDPAGGLTFLFPPPDVLADADPSALAMPVARRATFLRLARALADGSVDLSPGTDSAGALAALAALPGIGPWTVGTIAMRALGDGDAFLPSDLGVRLAAQRLGLPSSPGALTRRAAAWRPFRAYAVQHLWATGDHAVNAMPA